MKKVLLFAFLAALIGTGAFFFWKQKESISHRKALDLYAKQSLNGDEAAIYRVTFELLEKSAAGDKVLMRVGGRVQQSLEGIDKALTSWEHLDTLIYDGEELAAGDKDSLKGKPMLSVASPESVDHDLAAVALSENVLRVHKTLMQAWTLPRLPLLNEPKEMREGEELGHALVRYSSQLQGKIERMDKVWLSYEESDVTIDTRKNQAHFYLTRDGRVLAMDMHRVVHRKGPKESDWDYRMTVELEGKASKSLSAAPVLEMQAKASMTYGEALRKLPTVTAASDSAEVYQIFSAFKSNLIAHPDHAQELVDRVLEIKERDAGSKRQMTTLFGAMAQSESGRIADLLSGLLLRCPDDFCKEQAILALSDHQNPTPQSAEKVLDIVKSPGDRNLTSMAVLALGSMARKVPMPQLPSLLIEAYKRPENKELRGAFLAAMGNHGAADYLPLLQQSLKDKDASLRAAASYSLRSMAGPSVNGLLLSQFEREKDRNVQEDVLKAMNYRSFLGPEYQRIARKALELKDEEQVLRTVSFLLKSYQKDPPSVEGALKLLREKSSFPSVRYRIESENPRI